ncbi:putative polyketide biosynthesis zinc-dependent hydrolase BaeB [Planctomycetes bacterium Pan216]|uniref:Putative polyketide biosynthesis zinc-dependent hydrolase BaeB n=1 Tax=Kolteria novifilia TaxID=2527975 RepID=A0A518B999_9BACT|nr:putative polyketide biosynthesis zinc-dependent hydrolase BaeB [Planctomycetes bacterium Pan216]
MIKRRFLFPDVIEMNYQAGHRLGVNVYLIANGDEYVLIDIGYEDTVDEIIDLVRRMDFSLSSCKMLIATHADCDHTQGLKRAADVFKAPIVAHPDAVEALESGDAETTFSRIKAQGIDLPMPPVKVAKTIEEGDTIKVGERELHVWSTPGHTAGQLAFKMGNILFVGDNIYRDGSVGVIDAHHGSSIPDFITSLQRILADDSEFLLPSHGPVFRRDNALIQKTIDRLTEYQYLADFGTCAVSWPLLNEWEAEVTSGVLPFQSSGGQEASEPNTSAVDKKERLPGALS